MADAPGVFLSHAGEDNDRFARRFAKRLQEAGFRVWFDEWELLPGDSLVDKVFEEGLKDADAMVVVLSANSVDKPWVREELNAGFIKRIEGNCKLIPVVLDDVEVPGALRSTVWQRIGDLDSYEAELDRIVRAIHDDRNRPMPGASPGYAQTTALPGLYSTDTRYSCKRRGTWQRSNPRVCRRRVTHFWRLSDEWTLDAEPAAGDPRAAGVG